MRVLFDVSCLDRGRFSGVVTYARHLTYALSEKPEVQIAGCWKISRRRSLEGIRRHWQGDLMPYFPVWTEWRFGSQYQIFHGPDYEIPSLRRMARVVTIHDLSFFEDGFGAPGAMRARREKVTHLLKKQRPEAIIAVSKFTRQKILERFPEYADRVFAVWHGADHLLVPANKAMRPIPYPYFLFVGNLEARKNIVGLIRAFDRLKRLPEHKDTRLILVGLAGYGFAEIKQACREAREPEHIVLPGFLSNIQLVNYYQWAEAFVYPSHYEGFGFPIIEAMRLGCPVVTSQLSATEEVAGNAAVLVNSSDPEDIAHAMARVASDQSLRQDLVQKGVARGRSFTWSACADETLGVYQQAIQRHGKGLRVATGKPASSPAP